MNPITAFFLLGSVFCMGFAAITNQGIFLVGGLLYLTKAMLFWKSNCCKACSFKDYVDEPRS